MSRSEDVYTAALDAASSHARRWLAGVQDRPVAPQRGIDDLLPVFGGPVPESGTAPELVVEQLATGVEPGLTAIASGRFYGWVMGGVLPAALGADWLVSAWDQNSGLRYATPGTVAVEEAAAGWVLELLGLPVTAAVGFVTGGTVANLTCLAAARTAVLSGAGWDLDRDGLFGAPRVHVLVGEERHDTIDLAMRYLGLGAPVVVAADDQGRILPGALKEALAAVPDGAPLVVCLQAGNVHSGAFDPFAECIALARERAAWVHVDGAFGLWAAAAPRLAPLLAGATGADSWATDAHKTLNVPYDCGLAGCLSCGLSAPSASTASVTSCAGWVEALPARLLPLVQLPPRTPRGLPLSLRLQEAHARRATGLSEA